MNGENIECESLLTKSMTGNHSAYLWRITAAYTEIKKFEKIFLMGKEILKGSGAQSHTWKGAS